MIYRAADLNNLACKCTSRTLAHNSVSHSDCLCMDLVSTICCSYRFRLLVCNNQIDSGDVHSLVNANPLMLSLLVVIYTELEFVIIIY